MDKKRFFDFLYVILIISLILFMVWVVFYLRGNAKECLADPVGYFEMKNEETNCVCYRNNLQLYREKGYEIDKENYPEKSMTNEG